MRISTWITSLYICGLISVNKVVGDDVLYGGSFTLYCGGGSERSGEWFHNRQSTGVNSNSYTITNANFSHDGEYQCKRNGVDVLNPPLEVIVYGRRSITALNCNSLSNGVCVRNVIRGQPVTLCAAFTTIPPSIPEGKRVSNISGSAWYKNREGDDDYLYSCTTSSCKPDSSVNHSLYTNVNISCLTINNVQESQQYTLYAAFDPQHSPHPSVIFDVTYASPTLSPTSSPPPTSSTISTIPTSIINTTVITGPLETSVPSPGAPIPAIILPIIVVLVIVIIVVVVILAAVFKYQNRKRFSLSMINGNKLRNSQVTLQSPDIIPSKLDSGNHVNRPHLLPVNGHMLGGDSCTDTPGSQHCLLPQSPGNLNESSPVTYNGTSPQSFPPPPYSFVSGSPSKGNSRDQLALDLGSTSLQPNDDEEVDVGDFGAGPLGEPKTVQINP